MVQFGVVPRIEAVQFGVVPRIGVVSRIAEERSLEGEWLQVVPLIMAVAIMAVPIMAVATVIQTINIAVEAATIVAECIVAVLW